MNYITLTNDDHRTIANLLIINDKRTITAVSYETEIARCNVNEKRLDICGYHSPTSTKHLNAFLKYLGIEHKLIKQDLLTTYTIQL